MLVRQVAKRRAQPIKCLVRGKGQDARETRRRSPQTSCGHWPRRASVSAMFETSNAWGDSDDDTEEEVVQEAPVAAAHAKKGSPQQHQRCARRAPRAQRCLDRRRRCHSIASSPRAASRRPRPRRRRTRRRSGRRRRRGRRSRVAGSPRGLALRVASRRLGGGLASRPRRPALGDSGQGALAGLRREPELRRAARRRRSTLQRCRARSFGVRFPRSPRAAAPALLLHVPPLPSSARRPA